MFPTEQIQRIIAAAGQGKSVLELTVYDGSDNGEKVYNTLTVIGQPIPATAPSRRPIPPPQRRDEIADALAGDGELLRPRRRSKDGEQTPVYAMSFELYENGVSRALVLDYNDFVICRRDGKVRRQGCQDSKPCK